MSDGATNLEGRVEVCVGNSWGTVCHKGWNNVDAQVVCKQLGHPNSGKINKYINYISKYINYKYKLYFNVS